MRGVTRFGGVHPSGVILLSALCDVKSELVIDIAIELVAMKERTNAKPKFTKPIQV
jgi:hypothetical protein